MASTDEIMRAIGRFEAKLEGMAGSLEEEKERTSDHRKVMYGKLDHLEESSTIVGQIAAQARDKAAAVEKIVVEDVKPVTDEVKRMRALGLAALGAVGIAAGALGVTAATFGDTIVNWIRTLLRIQ